MATSEDYYRLGVGGGGAPYLIVPYSYAGGEEEYKLGWTS
jgi:hypothetical protein